jgi:hypothetical protein
LAHQRGSISLASTITMMDKDNRGRLAQFHSLDAFAQAEGERREQSVE